MILEFIKTRNICVAASTAADYRNCCELLADALFDAYFKDQKVSRDT